MKPKQRVALVAALAVCAISIGVVFARQAAPQISGKATGHPSISEYLQTHADADFRNVSAFVIHEGQAYYGGLGTDADDEFEIASITKTFTAELLRRQLDAGEIELSTTVGEVLGSQVAEAPVAATTVEELADHTSGLPRIGNVGFKQWVAPFFNANPYGELTHEDVIDFARQADLKKRGEYVYSNLGYALLGQVLATNKDTSFTTLLQEEILDPLGVEDTYLMEIGTVDAAAPRGGESAGRLADAWEMEGFLPAAGLRSTPRDISIYAQHLLETGLPEYTWAHAEQTGAYWHDGESFGFGAVLIVDPAAGTATFIAADVPTSVVQLGLDLHSKIPGRLD